MNKIYELINWFNDKKKVLIALSGGVDSALVAYAAFQKLGDLAIAVTADYKTLSKDELNSAQKICSEIGIKQIIINYNELENENFVRNDNKRCFYCRDELATHLIQLGEKLNAKTIVDGTQLDDLGDYRPGIDALRSNGIQSPLVEIGFTKNQIRNEAKKIGLSIYDRPSNSCLASRIPWGLRVTAERLTRIEVGESFVKQILNVNQVRVRDLDGIAKIEIEPQELKQLSDESKINEITDKLEQIGFKSVLIDPEGYKSGKINVIAD
ncbi:MAG: ATP-dependent sacrificial sulfur transferase LarE [Nitrosopumilaceae archaeon]